MRRWWGPKPQAELLKKEERSVARVWWGVRWGGLEGRGRCAQSGRDLGGSGQQSVGGGEGGDDWELAGRALAVAETVS